jgi:hypothetical protein
MADTPTGMKINFDEQNMTKWEVLMDGPEQSIYAVRDMEVNKGMADTKGRAVTSSSRLHSRPSIPLSLR